MKVLRIEARLASSNYCRFCGGTFKMNKHLKVSILIALGYSVYLFANWLGDYTADPQVLGHKFYVEPLLICILGSYYVTNYST